MGFGEQNIFACIHPSDGQALTVVIPPEAVAAKMG